MPNPTSVADFDALLQKLQESKPNDRSQQDRYWAIVITEVEKAKAIFVTYAQPPAVELITD